MNLLSKYVMRYMTQLSLSSMFFNRDALLPQLSCLWLPNVSDDTKSALILDITPSIVTTSVFDFWRSVPVLLEQSPGDDVFCLLGLSRYGV